MDAVTCDFVPTHEGQVCQRCGYLWTGKGAPVRHCRPPQAPRRVVLKHPCRFVGETMEPVDCRSCGGKVQIKTFACSHPAVSEGRAGWTSKALPEGVAACLECDYYPRESAMLETVAAVTTTDRPTPTLAATLRSLKAAGFDRVYVFSDGGEPAISEMPRSESPSEIPSGGSVGSYENSFRISISEMALPDLEIIVRPKRLGAWSNWLLSFAELTLRHPEAKRYAIFQDDVLAPRNLAAWLESNVDDSAPVWSLFCAGAHSSNSPGWQNVHPSHGGYGFCGAQAFVIPNAWALKLLADPGILSHKRNPPGKGEPKSHWKGTGENHVDGAIGRFAHDAGFPVKTHYPSLVSHVGEASSMYPHKTLATTNRKERAFVGETYDLMNPLVACVMLSGGAPERQRFALDAIRDFHAQTYERRLLVIVDNHETPLSDFFDVRCDSRIVYLRTQPAPLGALRNLGLTAARKAGADLFMPWDDDDRRSPERIAAQVAATPLGGASVLRSHVVRAEGREDVVRRWEGTNPRLPGYPGLLLAPLYYPLKYKPEQRHEDTKFVAELWKWTRVVGLDLDPSLYVRRIHGNNVSPPEHFERLLGATAAPRSPVQSPNLQGAS